MSEKMLEKFDVLVLSGGLTDDDYKELVAQINNLSKQLTKKIKSNELENLI